MKFIYILDYSTPSRLAIMIDGDIDGEELNKNIDQILEKYNLKESECAWLISNEPVNEETYRLSANQIKSL